MKRCSCTDVNVLLCCGTRTCQDSSRGVAGFLSLETNFSNAHFMPELPGRFLQPSFTLAFGMGCGPHNLPFQEGRLTKVFSSFYFWFWRQDSAPLLDTKNPRTHREAEVACPLHLQVYYNLLGDDCSSPKSHLGHW